VPAFEVPAPDLPALAVVLPPREAFSAAESGAIGMLVHRLAGVAGGFDVTVLGRAVATPFAGADFHPIRPAWQLANSTMRYAAGVAGWLRRRRPALIEVHNRPDVALFLARRFPAVTLVLHNDPQGMRRARTPADRQHLASRLARVVTVSEWLRGRFVEGIAAPLDIAVLPNCIDLRAIPPSPAPREKLILFVGRVVSDKGAGAFVAACARALPQLPGWRAEMIGADRFGVPEHETPFLHRLRPLAAAARVAMPGWRPHDQVLAAMARAALVVVPSRWPEPFGLTALEAMACGAAVLASARGGLPEVVGDVAVTIDPDDVPGLAAAMLALAGDAERRDALGAAGRARAALFDVIPAVARMDALRAAAASRPYIRGKAEEPVA